MLCIMFVVNSSKADTQNWCGVYFQENNRSYLNIVRGDVAIGSSQCNHEDYEDGRGLVRVMLDFNRGRSTHAKWRKFAGHLIEVRGKYKNGTIDGVRLVRDLGS